MTDTSDTPAEPPRQERDIAQELRLRPERPRVTRISRKVLIGLGAAASIAVFGATIWALQANRRSGQSGELYSTDNKTTADGLANLPRDYTGLPRNVPPLGPPLPGDLGRPIVAAQNAGQAVTVPTMPTAPAVDPEEQRRIQEREAARLSKLFAGTSVREQVAALLPRPFADGTTGPAPSLGSADGPPASSGGDLRQNGQDSKLAFVNSATDKRTVSPDRLQAPASPYVVQAGTLTFGQSRVLLVWTRLIMPNGSSIVLERQPGADAQGYSGLEDEVDNHWGELFKAALLSTLLSVGSQAGTSGQQNDLISAIRQGASNSISQTGSQIVGRQLNIQPTLTIRPGFPIRVIVNRDLVLAPYGL
jgi:type IV secretory pathway VirB10-like protein